MDGSASWERKYNRGGVLGFWLSRIWEVRPSYCALRAGLSRALVLGSFPDPICEAAVLDRRPFGSPVPFGPPRKLPVYNVLSDFLDSSFSFRLHSGSDSHYCQYPLIK